MNTASKFSLLVFAPVLIAFLLPTLFPLPAGVLITLLAIFDPTVSFAGAASYGIWVIGPVAAAFGLFLGGRWLHSLCLRGRSPCAAWRVIWAVFSVSLFIAIWIGFTVLTSVGASDKPAHIFLSWTALIAAGLTLLAQGLVIPWLVVVSRMLPGVQVPETTATTRPGNEVLVQE